MTSSRTTTWPLGWLGLAGIIAIAALIVTTLTGAESESKDAANAELKAAQENPELRGAYFAGGCFWCTEAVFEKIEGVQVVISGYAGGAETNPSYKDVSYGRTSHTEAIAIFYDPYQITYESLLDWFWKAHDPTQVNRQGPDTGTQYRSAIFYTNDEEKAAIDQSLEKVAGTFDKPIATEVKELDQFWPAEDYHQDFAQKNPGHPYLRQWLTPKLKKLDLN